MLGWTVTENEQPSSVYPKPWENVEGAFRALMAAAAGRCQLTVIESSLHLKRGLDPYINPAFRRRSVTRKETNAERLFNFLE